MLRRSNDYLELDAGRDRSRLDARLLERQPADAGRVDAIVFLAAGGSSPPVAVIEGGSVAFDSTTVDRVVFVFTNPSADGLLRSQHVRLRRDRESLRSSRAEGGRGPSSRIPSARRARPHRSEENSA